MLDRFGRQAKDSLLAPLVHAVPPWVTPTAITVASLPPGLAAAGLAAAGMWGWALLAFGFNRVLDGLDGLVARRRGRQSDLGGYLDIMVDFAVYATIPLGVWWGSGSSPGPLALLLAAFYVNGASWMFLSALIEKRRHRSSAAPAAPPDPATSVEMPGGLVEGTETVLFFTLFLALPAATNLLFAVMAAATFIGTLQRVWWAVRHLRR